MSKFEYEYFCGNCLDCFAVSKQKFTKEQAIDIAKYELGFLDSKYLAIGNGYVRHRAGVSEDNEPCVGWWLEYEEHKRSCPCWVFHTANSPNEWCNKDYEYIGYGENND